MRQTGHRSPYGTTSALTMPILHQCQPKHVYSSHTITHIITSILSLWHSIGHVDIGMTMHYLSVIIWRTRLTHSVIQAAVSIRITLHSHCVRAHMYTCGYVCYLSARTYMHAYMCICMYIHAYMHVAAVVHTSSIYVNWLMAMRTHIYTCIGLRRPA